MSRKFKLLLALALLAIAYKMFVAGPSSTVEVEYEASDD